MKILTPALLVSLAICAACSKKEDVVATTNAEPAVSPAPAPAEPAVTPSAPAVTSTGIPASPPTQDAPTSARVILTPAANSSVNGELMLANQGNAVSIRGEITGLTPDKEHGFHVHQNGACTLPDFTSAGDHFNPTNDQHGGPKSKTRHLGDIPNIKADKNGHALVDVTVEMVTLGDRDGAPADFLGKALVIHAMKDDYKTQPSGDSGARIACGVIG